jgi:hypothetical protein
LPPGSTDDDVKFANVVNGTAGKFATCVNDTDGHNDNNIILSVPEIDYLVKIEVHV